MFLVVWRRFLKVKVRKVDHLEANPIVRSREVPKKIIGKTIKKDLGYNTLNVDIIYDKIVDSIS